MTKDIVQGVLYKTDFQWNMALFCNESAIASAPPLATILSEMSLKKFLTSREQIVAEEVNSGCVGTVIHFV